MADRRVAGRRASPSDEGSVLVLVPVALLVMVMLGAVAVDLSMAYAGERRVADLAATWADRAVVQVADDAFYGEGGAVAVDIELATVAVQEARAALEDPGLHDVRVAVVRLDAVTLAVTVTAEVPYVLLDAVPGMRARHVDATSVATLVVVD